MKTMRVVIYNDCNWEKTETLVNSKEELIELLRVIPEYCELEKVEPINQYQSLDEVIRYFRELESTTNTEIIRDVNGEKYKIQF
jgi:hypothetical protein